MELILSWLLEWLETNDLILKAIHLGFHCFSKGLADELWLAATEKVWVCSAAALQQSSAWSDREQIWWEPSRPELGWLGSVRQELIQLSTIETCGVHNLLGWCLQLGLTNYHSIHCILWGMGRKKVLALSWTSDVKVSLGQKVLCMEDPYDLAEGSRTPAKAQCWPGKLSRGSKKIGVVEAVTQVWRQRPMNVG